jgi:anti-anti-sigma factor
MSASAGSAAVTVAAAEMLDIYSIDALLDAVLRAAAQRSGIIVDLGGASSLHTAALQVLAAAEKTCRAGGHPFSIAGVSAEVVALLERTGLDRLLLPAATAGVQVA